MIEHKEQRHQPDKPCVICRDPWIVIDDGEICIKCWRRGVRTIKKDKNIK